MVNQKKAHKTCDCGRGQIYTGENSKYNAKNQAGQQVCPECKLEDIVNQIRGHGGEALLQH